MAEARNAAISSQLLTGDRSYVTKPDVLEVIEHLGYVQIDTLSVVERAHHHVLWSRVPTYKPHQLHELVSDRKVFEYWGHAASYLPMKDYRFSLIRKREYARGKSHWFSQDKKIKRQVLNRIRREGPLQSKDFEAPEEKRSQWYYWKPAKRALEQLFMEGKLMIRERQGFQKVYDLTENVLPAEINTRMPTKMEYAMHLVERAVAAHGIVTENEICYQRGPWKEYVERAARKMLKEGRIIEWKLEGHEGLKCYGPADGLLIELTHAVKKVHILSPFDNLLIQRRRMQRLFDFDFTIECYVPEAKRKFGYFTLPVLYHNQFIARLDPKADRQEKRFYVRNLVFEETMGVDDEMLDAFSAALKHFVAFNGCREIIFEKCNRKKILPELKRRLKLR